MEVFSAVLNRRSVRRYATRAIPADALARLKTTLRAAPSACNLQPWHFVFVQDAALRRELAAACHGQVWIADAPLVVVACGEADKAYGQMGGSRSSLLIDVTIALDQLMLVALECGLGTCWIGAFEEDAIKNLLGIPANVQIIALTPVGFPEAPNLLHPVAETQRKKASEIISLDRYGGGADRPGAITKQENVRLEPRPR